MTRTLRQTATSILPQYAILPAAAPNGWSVSQIIYKKITFSITSDGLQIFHHTDSFSAASAGLEIGSFIQDIFSYNYPRYTSPPSSLDFTIFGTKQRGPLPGYIVYELDRKANWFFRTDAFAVTTADSNNVAATPEYFNLYHVPNSGDAAQPTPIQKDQGYSNIAYFSFVSPSINGKVGNIDPFNLYASVLQADGSLLDITIDPDITNTGGSPPQPVITGLGTKKRRRKA